MENEQTQPPQRHVWPWFVLAAFFFGIVLAIIWMTAEVRRARQRREYVIPSTNTNSVSPTPY